MAITKKKALILPFHKKKHQVYTQKKEPDLTTAGDARCLQCGHTWKAVMPVGTHGFPCPKCKTNFGAFVEFADIRNDFVYSCCTCNNTLFHILNAGEFQCPVCDTIILINEP